MDRSKSYSSRKFYRCLGPKVGRMQPGPPKRQKNLLFFKYIEGRVLLVLHLDKDLVFYYFQPTSTLMKSYTWDVLQNGQNSFRSLREVFFWMQGLDQSNFILQNNLLQIRFSDPSQLQANVKLQTVPKTTGHRKAELTGTQVLSEQMEKRHSHIQFVLVEKQRALELLRQELETIQKQRATRQCVQKQSQFLSFQRRACKKRRRVEIDLLDE